MNAVIIFGSKYGSARQYAEALSQKLNIGCFEYRKCKLDQKYDVILYVGSLYAGGVLGLKQTLKGRLASGCKKIMIITVGISDPDDTENTRNIENNIYKQLPEHFDKDIELFHVRGSLDYSKLCLKHRIMMRLMYSHIKKLPAEKQNEETRAFLSTYNQKTDFVDFRSLENIIQRYLLMCDKEVLEV